MTKEKEYRVSLSINILYNRYVMAKDEEQAEQRALAYEDNAEWARGEKEKGVIDEQLGEVDEVTP